MRDKEQWKNVDFPAAKKKKEAEEEDEMRWQCVYFVLLKLQFYVELSRLDEDRGREGMEKWQGIW